METRIFKSKNLHLTVIKNDNEEKLSVLQADIPYKDAGALIKSFGGIDEFWKYCHTQEEWDKIDNKLKVFAEQRKIRRENEKKTQNERLEKEKQEAIEMYQTLVSHGPIEPTYENVFILLRYLNTQNWGGWNLPKMSIGYSCNQYDCNGKTATTIKLDKKIKDPYTQEYYDKFVIGNPRGHLEKYKRIINPKYL